MCKSCFDCKNADVSAGSPDTRDYPGEPAMAECRLANTDKKLYALGEKNEWREDKMPAKCGHYDPVLYERCCLCKKEINSPVYSHKLFGSDHYSGESIPVCSQECMEGCKEVANKQKAEEAEWLAEPKQSKIKVYLSCSGAMISEDKVLFVDIAEDFQGADVLTFKCPKCKEEHTSRRFG